MSASSSAPLVPMWPPAWAEVFGEDDFGVFAECSVEGVVFVWRWLPPGAFWMGSPEDEEGRFDREGPRHVVEISKGFWLGETPVTQAQYEVITGRNPSHFKGAERPVEMVDWHDSVAFCEALEKRVPGLAVGLPTEAQWEYACRAGTETAYHNGGELEEVGWFDGNSGEETHPVKGKVPNEWGLFDMHGNVWEWCRDGRREYSEPLVGPDPVGPEEEGVARVVRGGSWGDTAGGCRSACRYWYNPGIRIQSLGFRLLAGRKQER